MPRDFEFELREYWLQLEQALQDADVPQQTIAQFHVYLIQDVYPPLSDWDDEKTALWQQQQDYENALSVAQVAVITLDTKKDELTDAVDSEHRTDVDTAMNQFYISVSGVLNG